MTSLLAVTLAHGARGGRGVSTCHYRRVSPELSGTPRHCPELPGNGSHNIHFNWRKFLRNIREWTVVNFRVILDKFHCVQTAILKLPILPQKLSVMKLINVIWIYLALDT